MAAITNNQDRTWKQEAIDRAAVVSDRWDVLMAWLGHFAVPVLTVSMFVSIAGMFPGVRYPEWVSSAILLLQVIFLDIGGLSLKTLAIQAHDKGQVRAAQNGRKMSTFLIGLLITTLVIVAVNQLAPVAGKVYGPEIKTAAGYIDIGLILVRVVSIVLYLSVVHDLKGHTALAIEPTQSSTQGPTHPLQNGKVDQLEETMLGLKEQLSTVVKALETSSTIQPPTHPTQEPLHPIQPSTQVVEEPTHALHFLAEVATSPEYVDAVCKPVEQDIYPAIQGVSAEKVRQLIALFESGTTWRDMPGNYSQTIKPVRVLYESLHGV